MQIEEKRIGTVIILDSESEQENTKEATKNYSSRQKIVFDGTSEEVYVYQSDKDSKMLQLLKEQVVYYCLLLKMERQKRAYYNEENFVILIDKLIGEEYVITIGSSDAEQKISVSEIVDEHFGGASVYEISEDANFIKKEYVSDKKILIIAFFSVCIIIVIWIFYILFFDEDAPPPPPPPKPVKSLSINEINQLKNIASIKALEWIFKYTTNTFKDNIEGGGRKRLVGLNQDKYTVLSRQKAKQRGDGSFYFVSPKYKRGAVEISYRLTLQESFAGIGFTVSKNKIYEKTERIQKKYTISDVNQSIKKILTRDCLKKALTFSKNGTIVHKREEKKIIVKFRNQNAVDFLKKTKTLLLQCPVYVKNLTLSGAKFNGDIIIYNDGSEKI